ncbi:hypothetical protein GPECTOR_10g891 [Gonium pectorale]|uniref:Uncharacterized protein n=1 Tax=Gonium pectorale TaxID=33097 RepID=A0A150GSG2_GONPE|nr:hypothetical protein GPECTOR_10g891 [Gonium pectorale]|eukprot:KXZ52260.1 hypothetical protein GPECTOR_10g891 [Gonium pectorale]
MAEDGELPVAGLSLRIEHLETEITDLERQLSQLVAEARRTQAEAAELETDVGALDEQLLQDSSSSGEDSGGDSEEEEEQDIGTIADGGAADSSAAAAAAAAAAPSVPAVALEQPVPAALPQAAIAVTMDSAAVVSTAPQLLEAAPAASRRRSEVGPESEVEDSARLYEAEEDGAGGQSLKPRGRPRSTAKARAAEAAAAAAAAADSRRKALEEKIRVPPDGLLHLPAHQFRPRFLQAARYSIEEWREEVLRLLPDEFGARELPSFHANAARHTAICGAVGRYLRQRRQLVAAKHEVLVQQYTRNMAAFKEYMQAEARRPPPPPPPLPSGRGSASASYGMYASSRAVSSYNPYAYSHSDVIRSDLDEQRLLNNFIAVEQLKHMCALPDMVLDPWERRWRAYDNRNGLVQDPVRELEEERMVKSWAEEERTQFMDRFLQHPKDFRKISTYLPGRSPGDCVAFFYKNQKLDEFGTVRRKQQLKKRRLQADMRKQQPLLVAPMLARQRAMGAGGIVGGDAGMRGGSRGRGGVRSAAGRGQRGANLSDTDNAFGPGPLGMGHNGLPMPGAPRAPPGSMPGYHSMMAAAHRPGLLGLGAAGEGRDLQPAPLLPPISSAASQQPSSPQYPQQQQPAATLPSGGSTGAGWTDEDFVECFRQHGKNWEAYCRHLGIRSEAAAKQYFYRHKERLGLDRIQPNVQHLGGTVEANGVTVIAAVSAAGPGLSLESSEVSRHESGRYKPDLDSEIRSDSEFDPAAAQGVAAGAGQGLGAAAVNGESGGGDGSLPQHIDLLAALRNPGGNPLTQLLHGGLLQAPGGGKGGSGTQLGGVLSQLLMQQQPHLDQQGAARENMDSQQGLGALAMGLNMLGDMTGVLQGGLGTSGTGAAGLSLFTGPSGVSQSDDPSGPLSSPTDDSGAGLAGNGGVGPSGRRFGANYWSQEEKDTFLEVFQIYGRDWARLAEAIPTKSTSQIKTYFHNYKTKLGFDKMELPPTAAQAGGRRACGDDRGSSG